MASGSLWWIDHINSISYWNDDNLDNAVLADAPRTHLISGCGDGGLIDLLRVRVNLFRHDSFMEEFLPPSDPEILRVARELLEIEGDRQAGDRAWLTMQYYGVETPKLDEKIRGRLRRDTRRCSTGPTRFLGLGSTILNRFLVSRLLKLNVTSEPGEVEVRATADTELPSYRR